MAGIYRLLACSIGLLAVLFASACQPIVAPNEPETAQIKEVDLSAQSTGSVSKLAPERIAELESLIETSMAEVGPPGLAIGVIVDGEVVYTKGFGVTEIGKDQPVTPQTIFQLASTAKTATSTAIMRLVEDGEIELDAPVTNYLPYFQVADERGAQITIRHLLMHTSGLPDNDWMDLQVYAEPRFDDQALEDHVRDIQNLSLLEDPGAQFSYSGLGYDVLGDVIAKISDQPFENYVEEHIFMPLGMQHTTPRFEDVNASQLAMPHVPNEDGEVAISETNTYLRIYAPDSMFYSNIEDMTKYAIAHLNHSALGQSALLTPASYDAVWTPYTETPFPPPENFYGYGWQLGEYQGLQAIGHSGFDIGYNSIFQMFPEKMSAVIVLTNYNDLEEFVMPAFNLRLPLLDFLISVTAQE